MTITIRPLHLAIFAAFVAGILVAGGIALGLSGGDDSDPADDTTLLSATESPTAVPTAEPTATPEPTQEPEPTAEPTEEPKPSSTPEIRTCEEIKADPEYRSSEERTFFLENCTGNEPAPTGNSSTGPAPTTTSPSSSAEATAAEQRYRDKAEASLTVFAYRLYQYIYTPSYGAVADLLEFGTVMRKFAQELDRLEPPPPRFERAHYQLRDALVVFADHVIKIVDVNSDKEAVEWADTYYALLDQVGAALDDYSIVVGIDFESLGQ